MSKACDRPGELQAAVPLFLSLAVFEQQRGLTRSAATGGHDCDPSRGSRRSIPGASHFSARSDGWRRTAAISTSSIGAREEPTTGVRTRRTVNASVHQRPRFGASRGRIQIIRCLHSRKDDVASVGARPRTRILRRRRLARGTHQRRGPGARAYRGPPMRTTRCGRANLPTRALANARGH